LLYVCIYNAHSRQYYHAASTDGVLHSVGVPLLAVNAGDDPVVRSVPEDAAGNPLVALMTTHGGGHLGWFTGHGLFGMRRWITAEDLVPPASTAPRVYEQDGWTTEEGREHLGLKLTEGVERIVGVEGEGLMQGL
jgi:hypothetical protein